jgi:hypothetical protein
MLDRLTAPSRSGGLKRDTMAMREGTVAEKTTYHVFLDHERWHVTADDRSHEWGDFASKDEAIREAKLLADAATPSEVVVHEPDGKTINEYRHRLGPARHN